MERIVPWLIIVSSCPVTWDGKLHQGRKVKSGFGSRAARIRDWAESHDEVRGTKSKPIA